MAILTQTVVPVHALRDALTGNARALLAIPEARADLPRLIAGKRPARFGATATEFGSRKAIAGAKTIVAEREARREARRAAEAARAAQPGRTLRRAEERAEARRAAILARTAPLVAEAFAGLYRTYRETTSVRFGEPAVSVQTTTKWVSGRRGFGKVTDSQTTDLRVPETWIDDVHGRGLDYLDGLLTLSAELVEVCDGIEVYRATWVRQGRGYDLTRERGMIARHVASGTTYHSTASDSRGMFCPRKAIAGLRRKMTAQGVPAEVRAARSREAAERRASRRAAQLGRLLERVARWDLDDIRDVVVTRADSIRAGNCEPGTDQFIDRVFPDRSYDSSATIGEIAQRVGRMDLTALGDAELTLARQIAGACLVAIRRDRGARRLVLA